MLLNSIKIKGLLSFRDAHLDLRSLNVLIGPNASGKSNLIEVVALLQAAPRGLAEFFRRSGGIGDWLWKGGNVGSERSYGGNVEVILGNPGFPSLRYSLDIAERGQQLDIVEERLENERPLPGYTQSYWHFHVHNGRGRLRVRLQEDDPERPRTQSIGPDDLTPGQSILHERKDPTLFKEVHFVGGRFDGIRLYREWNLGRSSQIRRPQPTDAPNDFLEEDFANLALVLNQLRLGPGMQTIEAHLRRFYETYEQLHFNIEANTAQLWIREKGLGTAIPATRLSDGTLRFLALLAILCNPRPPPLVCIEEPELGLHPEIIPLVAELLKTASEKTQLIVTTHSERLIDELSDDPESVVVCERDPEAGTRIERLSSERLHLWLEKYQLGELWRAGEIGGARW